MSHPDGSPSKTPMFCGVPLKREGSSSSFRRVCSQPLYPGFLLRCGIGIGDQPRRQ